MKRVFLCLFLLGCGTAEDVASSTSKATVYVCTGTNDETYLRAEVPVFPNKPINVYISAKKGTIPVLFPVPVADVTEYVQNDDALLVHAKRGDNPDFLDLDYDVKADTGRLEVHADRGLDFVSTVHCVL